MRILAGQKWFQSLGYTEGNGEFTSKTGFNLWDRKSETACDGFREIEMKRHGTPVRCFDSTLL
jgi:hypothetical protein